MNKCVAGQNLIYNKPKTKKKKNPKNAFSFYLDDTIKELKKQGQHFASKAEAVPIVSEKWKNMSPADKALYEEKARKWKIDQKKQPKSGRLDCTGQLIDNRINMDDLIDKQRKEARKFMKNEWPSGKGVCDFHFYIISFQSLFELPDEEGYQPCEVACVDYTLNSGIVQVWHHFIDPGSLKLGMRAEIKLFSEKTHQIPEEGFELASNQYHIIWDELLHFIKPNRSSNDYPPLLCKMSEMQKTLFCLDWLSIQAGVSNKLYKVYEVEDIAAELFDHGGMVRPSLSIVEEGCNSHMYDYEADTMCKYHEELECVHCALLKVKKCCYWMSDSLTKVYGFEITDSHLPVRKPPSFVITKPEMVAVDMAPRRQKFDGRNNDRYNKSPPSRYPAECSRDIRYRPTYDVVPSRVECTDFEPRPLASLTSPPRPGTERPPLDDDECNRSPRGNIPSLGHVRRPLSNPMHTRQPPGGSRLAANFQVSPKSIRSAGGEVSGEPWRGNIDELSQEFDGASVSSVSASEADDVSSASQAPVAYLGRGRGRSRFL